MSTDTMRNNGRSERGRRQSAEILERRCGDWNLCVPVGSTVEYHPVIGEPNHRVRKTRSEAYVLSGHSAVVFLEGESGCIALDACVALNQGS